MRKVYEGQPFRMEYSMIMGGENIYDCLGEQVGTIFNKELATEIVDLLNLQEPRSDE